MMNFEFTFALESIEKTIGSLDVKPNNVLKKPVAASDAFLLSTKLFKAKFELNLKIFIIGAFGIESSLQQ